MSRELKGYEGIVDQLDQETVDIEVEKTGYLQEDHGRSTGCSKEQEAFLGSETFTDLVLEPVENHARQLSCVKGCKPDRIRPSTFHIYSVNSSSNPVNPLSKRLTGSLTPYKQVQYIMSQRTFKNPAVTMPNGLQKEIIEALKSTSGLTIPGIAKTLGKPYREVEPTVQDLLEEGKIKESGTRISQFNRKRPEYKVKK